MSDKVVLISSASSARDETKKNSILTQAGDETRPHYATYTNGKHVVLGKNSGLAKLCYFHKAKGRAFETTMQSSGWSAILAFTTKNNS
jgi:hypothetical protein